MEYRDSIDPRRRGQSLRVDQPRPHLFERPASADQISPEQLARHLLSVRRWAWIPPVRGRGRGQWFADAWATTQFGPISDTEARARVHSDLLDTFFGITSRGGRPVMRRLVAEVLDAMKALLLRDGPEYTCDVIQDYVDTGGRP